MLLPSYIGSLCVEPYPGYALLGIRIAMGGVFDGYDIVGEKRILSLLLLMPWFIKGDMMIQKMLG